MKLIEKCNAAVLALRIEYHWWWILHLRRQGKRMLACGTPLSSPRLLRLSRRIDAHGLIANRCNKEYEKRFVPRPVVYQKSSSL